MASPDALVPLRLRVRDLIAAALVARGMNHTELAANLGVGVSRVSQMMTGGDNNLTLRMLERIEEACSITFQITVRDALTGVTRDLESIASEVAHASPAVVAASPSEPASSAAESAAQRV